MHQKLAYLIVAVTAVAGAQEFPPGATLYAPLPEPGVIHMPAPKAERTPMTRTRTEPRKIPPAAASKVAAEPPKIVQPACGVERYALGLCKYPQ